MTARAERPDVGADLRLHDIRLRALERMAIPYPHVNMISGLAINTDEAADAGFGYPEEGQVQTTIPSVGQFGGYISQYTPDYRHQNCFQTTDLYSPITVEGYTFQPIVTITRDGNYLGFFKGLVEPKDPPEPWDGVPGGVSMPFYMQDRVGESDFPHSLEGFPPLVTVAPGTPLPTISLSGDDDIIDIGTPFTSRDLVIPFTVRNASIDIETGLEYEDPDDYQPFHIFGKSFADFGNPGGFYAAELRLTIIRLWDGPDTFV